LKLKSAIIFFCFILAFHLRAQDYNSGYNLRNYYDRNLNFGFLISFNRAYFTVDPSIDFTKIDSLKSIRQNSLPGFNLGIISEVKLHKYFTLRFVPNIAFCERTIDYTVVTKKRKTTYIKNVESTFLNFPLNIKMRSKRVGNFGAYVLTGGAYNLDLASKKNLSDDISPALSQQIVKIKRDDISYEVGAGTEFYLQYFKFAIEAKLSIGTKNMLIKENTIFANSINKLNSKIFFLSITFEG
jgi:hypothetical protein